ncbi:MAG: arsenate reductase family protein [Clostridiaceae bacterium]
MSYLFLQYPKCSTCRNAKKWLEANDVDFLDRHIVEENPTKEELKSWHQKSGLPLKKFFNTSGNLYKELKLKDKLPEMSEEEQLELLATNGMLIKRPLLIGEDKVLVGFKEDNWKEELKEV